MGLFDKAKRLLGLGGDDDDQDEVVQPVASRPIGANSRRRDPRGRPPLADAPPPSQSVEDVLALRDEGDREGARKLLAEIDRGSGLRTVLRAAAALEASDEDDLERLLPAVVTEVSGYRLLLQIASALDGAPEAAPFVRRAEALGAPPWAVAWTRATSTDETTRREGLVDLLFADAALARTVAARDLDVGGALSDASAAQRYASFAHGRDSIRRFDAKAVARLAERVLGSGA